MSVCGVGPGTGVKCIVVVSIWVLKVVEWLTILGAGPIFTIAGLPLQLSGKDPEPLNTLYEPDKKCKRRYERLLLRQLDERSCP